MGARLGRFLAGMSTSVQQDVIKLVNEASKKLLEAYSLAVKANPMAQDLPVFKRLMELQKELGTVMQEISKVRGL